MSLFFRHIFREVFSATFTALALFIFVLLTGNALKDIIGLLASKQLSIYAFFKLLGLLIPYVLVYSMPLALLAGVLLALGRLSSQHEVTAMKSSGVSLYRITRPVMFIASCFVVLSLFINFYYAPQTRTQYKELKSTIIFENPLNFLEPKTFINDFPGYSIFIGERNGSRVRDFWIWMLDDEKRVKALVRADEGRIHFRPQENAVIINMYNSAIERRPTNDPENLQDNSTPVMSSEYMPLKLSLDGVLNKVQVHKKLNMMTLSELLDDMDSPEASEEETIKKQTRIRMQIHQNSALAVSSLSLAFIAIPLAIRVGRKETLTNSGLALGLAIIYYFLLNLLSMLEKFPVLQPHLLLWLPNILYFIGGFILFKKANRF